MASERYVLKHFFYGQFVKEGKPGGDLRLLAKTQGLSDEEIAEAIQLAFVPPMKGVADGSWTVVRGKKQVPFALVEAEFGEANQPMLHFILLPIQMLRALGGNLQQLAPLVAGKMPSYDSVGNALKPLVMSNLHAPQDGDEVNTILDLMTFTKNRLNIMEGILAAVVQGMPLVIRDAPEIPKDRVTFIQGLLCLLPPSVRFAVTFATHTLPTTKIDVQVRFISGEGADPDGALVYNWKSGKLEGKPPEDGYSHFIISQLRLDAEGVVKQTRRLTNIANWRVRRGDRLADALAYASQRMSIDDAVLNNQPVEASEVSKILANDPTLTDELRLSYARHLMSFSMALGQLQHAEPLGIMLRQNKELADTALRQLQQAMKKGASGDIYDLLEKWLGNPLGPQGKEWVDLTHTAAFTYLNDVIDGGDTEEMASFLRDVDLAGATVVADKLLPRLIEISLPLAVMDPELARTIFVIGAKQMPAADLMKLISTPTFLDHMPDAFKRFVRALKNASTLPMLKILPEAAKDFEAERVLIVLRLAELALERGRYELFDDAALKVLVRAAAGEWGTRYEHVLKQIVAVFSEETRLKALGEPGTRYLLGILLAMGAYDELARRAMDQSKVLYAGERQTEYAKMIEKVFAETLIPTERVPVALQALHDNKFRSLPLVMAYIGVLEGYPSSEMTDAVAGDVTDLIVADKVLQDVLPVDAATTLSRYHIGRKDTAATLKMLEILAPVAARYGSRTAGMVSKAYQRLDWDATILAQRLEMLRAYIRAMERAEARNAVVLIGKALGEDIRNQLEATYALKSLMDDHDVVAYAGMLHGLADFLNDTGESYYNPRNVPSQNTIEDDLAALPGGLNKDEKRQIADNIQMAGLMVAKLAEQHAKVRNAESERRIDGLLKAQENPQSPLEVMRVMAGYLTQGRRFELELKEQVHPYPLPRRTGHSLRQEVELAHYLLKGTYEAFLENEEVVQAKAIYAEMDSIWGRLPVETQREIVKDFATDLQRLADLVTIIASKSEPKTMEESSIGRRLEENRARPRNTLEFYRYVAGYYRARL